MFPVFAMHPSSMREQGLGRHPYFEGNGHRLWPLIDRCRSSQCGNHRFYAGAHPCAPFWQAMQNMAEKYTRAEAKNQEKKEKSDENSTTSNCPRAKEEDGQRNGPKSFPFQPLLGGILKEAMESFEHCEKSTEPKKWHQEVDCRGFKSKNIRVKIDARLLLIKAHKKEESEFGVSTSSMRKNVPLPENIDRMKIRCKLSPDGKLIIEAPFTVRTKDKESTPDFVKNVLGSLFPGLEGLLAAHLKQEPNKEEDRTNVSGEQADLSKDSDVNAKENQLSSKTKTSHTVEKEKVAEQGQDIVEKINKSPDDNNACMEKETEVHNSEQVNDEDVGKPYVTFPVEDQHSEGHCQADQASESSEDSFVLLSEIEKEIENEQDRQENGDIPTVSHGFEGENQEDMVSSLEIEEDGNTGNDVQCNGSSMEDKTQTKEMECQYLRGRESMSDLDKETKVNATNTKGGVEIERDNLHNKDFLYQIEMPSYDPETIKVNFDESDRVLMISANKVNSFGLSTETMTKTVHIDGHIDPGSLQCVYRDGILSVTAPRKTPVRKIPITL